MSQLNFHVAVLYRVRFNCPMHLPDSKIKSWQGDNEVFESSYSSLDPFVILDSHANNEEARFGSGLPAVLDFD